MFAGFGVLWSSQIVLRATGRLVQRFFVATLIADATCASKQRHCVRWQSVANWSRGRRRCRAGTNVVKLTGSRSLYLMQSRRVRILPISPSLSTKRVLWTKAITMSARAASVDRGGWHFRCHFADKRLWVFFDIDRPSETCLTNNQRRSLRVKTI